MRKGQGNAGAITALIVIIALFIVLYVLLLNPEDREALLNDENGDNGDDENGDEIVEKSTLLLESPGFVTPIEENKLEHDLDSINLFVRNEPELDVLASSISVSRSLFGKQDQTLRFGLDDLSNVDEVLLSFIVRDPKGTLFIDLNGFSVYSNSLSGGRSEIVALPKEFLESNNVLTFYTNNPGVAFWSKNQYHLSEVTLKKQFEFINSRETRQFFLGDEEHNSLDKAVLEYFIYCNQDSGSTMLKIFVNNKQLPIENLRCTSGERSVEIDGDDLRKGTNEIMFLVDNGDYTFNDIKIVSDLKEKLFKTYYFTIDSDDYRDIIREEQEVVLFMKFNDDEDLKRAEILINEDSIFINTGSDTYSKEISSIIEQGENLLKIIPEEEFEINSLRITLQDV